MGNNIATYPPLLLGRYRKQKQNTDYGGKTWVAGKTAEPISPRVAASLGEPMLLRGPEEGCPFGRTIGQMVRWHHPGEIRTYFLGSNIGLTRRGGAPLGGQ